MKSKLKYPNTMEEAVAFTTQFYEEAKERMATFSLKLFAEHPEWVLPNNRHKLHEFAHEEMMRLTASKNPTVEQLLDALAVTMFATREMIVLKLATNELDPNRN